jgi:hypothetical protein
LVVRPFHHCQVFCLSWIPETTWKLWHVIEQCPGGYVQKVNGTGRHLSHFWRLTELQWKCFIVMPVGLQYSMMCLSTYCLRQAVDRMLTCTNLTQRIVFWIYAYKASGCLSTPRLSIFLVSLVSDAQRIAACSQAYG